MIIYWGVEPGHGANSQFGPVLPTALPSGQIFASSVQAFGVGVGLGGHMSSVSGIKHLGFASRQAGRGLHVGVGIGIAVDVGLGEGLV